jgi:hypothetical protein
MYRAAKFVSAISAGVVGSVPFATAPVSTLEAAEECLAKPRETTPPGQHWYYLIDRGSKRHCWYLHQETATSSHAAISRRARRAEIVAARDGEPAVTRTPRDAHAELGLPQGRDGNAAQVSQQTLIDSDYQKVTRQDRPDTVSGESAQSVLATRWPEPAGVLAASIEPPPSSLAVASATPDVGTADVTAKAPPVVLTSADTPATETSSSLKSLLLATVGAITISGFAGSSVYLLAQIRRRPQPRASLSRGPGLPPAEWVDRTLPPPWLYRDHAHEAENFIVEPPGERRGRQSTRDGII